MFQYRTFRVPYGSYNTSVTLYLAGGQRFLQQDVHIQRLRKCNERHDPLSGFNLLESRHSRLTLSVAFASPSPRKKSKVPHSSSQSMHSCLSMSTTP